MRVERGYGRRGLGKHGNGYMSDGNDGNGKRRRRPFICPSLSRTCDAGIGIGIGRLNCQFVILDS